MSAFDWLKPGGGPTRPADTRPPTRSTPPKPAKPPKPPKGGGQR
ncbi:hypothetical protein AB0M91_09195 [Micromonospora rifamycinica]